MVPPKASRPSPPPTPPTRLPAAPLLPRSTSPPSSTRAPESDLPSESSSRSFGSYRSESLLEVLDNDDGEDENEMIFDDEEEGEIDADQPLVNRGRKRRTRWEGEEKNERGLIEIIPSLILAHPLPLLPLLALLPYNFLPGGVVIFVPVFCVLAILSACAHIVIVYLTWYLKVGSFEQVAASVAGKYSKFGLWGGRIAVVSSVVGLVVGWLGTIHPLLEPAIRTYLPENALFASRIVWTMLPALTLLPSLLPSRIPRSLRRSPIILALLLPIVAFLVIGRTVEINKAAQSPPEPEPEPEIVARALKSVGAVVVKKFGLVGSSAGAGLTTLTVFLTPHLNTLQIHSHLPRTSRSSFPFPCFSATLFILLLSLPFSLVPYYLLPSLTDDNTAAPISSSPSGVFARLPADDGWVNLARVLMAAVVLGTSNMWLLRGRDCLLSVAIDFQGEWIGIGLWAVVLSITCLGGWVAEKIEILGLIAVLAVGWFLPCPSRSPSSPPSRLTDTLAALFFIITFHLRSPLAIVFPSAAAPPPPTNGHNRTNSLQDPSTDVLLARKERQLQKRRLGRRLWQDLIVYVGILPVGSVTILWSLGRLIGVW